jgi:phosphoribosylpyrophosphate synthetase
MLQFICTQESEADTMRDPYDHNSVQDQVNAVATEGFWSQKRALERIIDNTADRLIMLETLPGDDETEEIAKVTMRILASVPQ